MVQLSVLRGQQAGARFQVGCFPFSIGRGASDLRCDDAGVWDGHAQLICNWEQGIQLRSNPEAFTAVNGVAVSEATLRNGDILEFGACKVQFSLGPVRQGSLRLREVATWIFLAGVTGVEILAIYLLLRQ